MSPPNTQLVSYDPVVCDTPTCNGILNPHCGLDFATKTWVCPFCFKRNILPGPYAAKIAEDAVPLEMLDSSETIEYMIEDPWESLTGRKNPDEPEHANVYADFGHAQHAFDENINRSWQTTYEEMRHTTLPGLEDAVLFNPVLTAVPCYLFVVDISRQDGFFNLDSNSAFALASQSNRDLETEAANQRLNGGGGNNSSSFANNKTKSLLEPDLEAVKNAILDSVEQLPPQARLGLILYDATVRIYELLGRHSEQAQMSESNRIYLRNSVSNIEDENFKNKGRQELDPDYTKTPTAYAQDKMPPIAQKFYSFNGLKDNNVNSILKTLQIQSEDDLERFLPTVENGRGSLKHILSDLKQLHNVDADISKRTAAVQGGNYI